MDFDVLVGGVALGDVVGLKVGEGLEDGLEFLVGVCGFGIERFELGFEGAGLLG